MGVVLRAVGEWLWWVPVDERVHGEGGAERVKVEDVEYVVFVHEGLCVRVVPLTPLLHAWSMQQTRRMIFLWRRWSGWR